MTVQRPADVMAHGNLRCDGISDTRQRRLKQRPSAAAADWGNTPRTVDVADSRTSPTVTRCHPHPGSAIGQTWPSDNQVVFLTEHGSHTNAHIVGHPVRTYASSTRSSA